MGSQSPGRKKMKFIKTFLVTALMVSGASVFSCEENSNTVKFEYAEKSTNDSNSTIGFRFLTDKNGNTFRYGNPIIPLNKEVFDALKDAVQSHDPICATGTFKDRTFFVFDLKSEK